MYVRKSPMEEKVKLCLASLAAINGERDQDVIFAFIKLKGNG
jgi:hypothetical protein